MHLQSGEIPIRICLNSVCIALRVLRQVLSLSFFQRSFSQESLFILLVEMLDVTITRLTISKASPCVCPSVRLDLRIAPDCNLDGNIAGL